MLILHVTQQDKDAEQDSDECSGAETSGGEEGLGLAGWRSEAALTRTHTQREGGGAAECRLSSVPHHHSQLIELLIGPTEAPAPGHDTGTAIC